MTQELFLAVPPFLGARHNSPYIEINDWASLVDVVDGWSVMLYDYSSGDQSPGPNAPLKWFKKNVEIYSREDEGALAVFRRALFLPLRYKTRNVGRVTTCDRFFYMGVSMLKVEFTLSTLLCQHRLMISCSPQLFNINNMFSTVSTSSHVHPCCVHVIVCPPWYVKCHFMFIPCSVNVAS